MAQEQVKLHPLRRQWTYLRQVVMNPRCPEYDPNLEVEGLLDFHYFCEWVEHDIGPRPPAPGNKLVRRDYYKGVVPGNIQWGTQRTISSNGLQFPKYSYGHKRKNMQDWARELDISYWSLMRRLRKGYKIKDIVKYCRQQGLVYGSSR